MNNRILWIITGVVILGILGASFVSTRPKSESSRTQTDTGTPATGTPPSSNALATQTSDENAMTVVVTPARNADGSWQFAVAVDNHTVNVTQDMVAIASLTDASGTLYVPTAWEGDPPGGHHRSGTLLFGRIADPRTLTLTLRDLGGVAERAFRWSEQE